VELLLYCAVLTSAAGLYTLAYIDCACFKIKSNDSPLLHFLKCHRPTSIPGRRPEHGSFIRHHLLSLAYTEGLVLFCNELNN